MRKWACGLGTKAITVAEEFFVSFNISVKSSDALDSIRMRILMATVVIGLQSVKAGPFVGSRYMAYASVIRRDFGSTDETPAVSVEIQLSDTYRCIDGLRVWKSSCPIFYVEWQPHISGAENFLTMASRVEALAKKEIINKLRECRQTLESAAKDFPELSQLKN